MPIYVLYLTRLSDRLLTQPQFLLGIGGLAASTIARALGPAFVGGFGKALGGPAVIAAVLAVAAVSCTLTL